MGFSGLVRGVCAGVIGVVGCVALGGSLNPPAGVITPTPGPEPRIAINATNTPGDVDSVYRITQPGSYYLAGNVTGANGKRGIKISASNVSIDLMGFELMGVTGSLDGISVSTSSLFGIEVRNGSVRLWDGSGINLQTSLPRCVTVTGIRASQNALSGVRVSDGARVTECIAYANDGEGIVVGDRGVVSGCVARDNDGAGVVTAGLCVISDIATNGNGLDGLVAGTGSTVSGVTATDNGDDGIDALDGCVVVSCASTSNIGHGIDGGVGCTITGCAVSKNRTTGINVGDGSAVRGCTSVTNVLDGIMVASDCHVVGNSSDSNGTGGVNAAGIRVTGSDNVLDGNTCTDNDYGFDVDGPGNVITSNRCAGSDVANWDVVAGNFLVVVNASSSGAVTGDAGGGSLGSTNPSVNYSY